MTAYCDRRGNITTTRHLFAFNPGQMEKLRASLRVIGPYIRFLKVNYTQHKLLTQAYAVEFQLLRLLRVIRGCFEVEIRSHFGEHDLDDLKSTMCSPMPEDAESIDESQQRLVLG